MLRHAQAACKLLQPTLHAKHLWWSLPSATGSQPQNPLSLAPYNAQQAAAPDVAQELGSIVQQQLLALAHLRGTCGRDGSGKHVEGMAQGTEQPGWLLVAVYFQPAHPGS